MPLRSLTVDLDTNSLTDARQPHAPRIERSSVVRQLYPIVEQDVPRSCSRVEVEDAALHNSRLPGHPV